MIGRTPRTGLAAGTGVAANVRRMIPLRWPATARVYEGDLTVDDPRHYAVVTTITDNFVGLGAAFLLSLHEQLAIRDQVDVILLQSPDVAPLSPENRALLAKVCPGLKVLDIDTSGFLNAANMARYNKEGRAVMVRRDRQDIPSKKAAYVKLNVLRLTQHEKVVLMDSDMMVLADFSEVFDLPHDLAAVPTGVADPDFPGEYAAPSARRRGLNTGFVLMSRRVRGAGPFNAAIDFLDLKRNKKLRDQAVLNEIFRSCEKLVLPHAYNHKLHIDDPEMLSNPRTLDVAKIVHFVERSKWGLKDEARAGQAIYDRFHALQRRTGAPFTLEP